MIVNILIYDAVATEMSGCDDSTTEAEDQASLSDSTDK